MSTGTLWILYGILCVIAFFVGGYLVGLHGYNEEDADAPILLFITVTAAAIWPVALAIYLIALIWGKAVRAGYRRQDGMLKGWK
jgi:hypothetical protein